MMDGLRGGQMPAPALLDSIRPKAARPVARPAGQRPVGATRQALTPSMLLALQRAAGNSAVRGRFGPEAQAAARPSEAVVQRCGPTPCDCSAEERAEYESEHDGPAAEVQRYEVQDCGTTAGAHHPAAEVHAAHGRARTMLSIAEMESATSSDPTVQALAMKYFKITVPPVRDSDKKLWFGRVRRVLSAMNSENGKTTYECEPAQSWQHGLCSAGTFAVTILNIHLCPKWWTLTDLDDRAFVLVHEWAHRYGPSVNQILETYCDASEFGGLSAGDLVAEPDAYASYIFELVTGKAPGATVC